MGSRWIACFAASCLGWLGFSSVSAFVLTGHDWSYQTNPMVDDWRVCDTGIPGAGVQRTKDSAAGWNYARFTFTFGTNACLSSGVYPNDNDINQVDFGGGLGMGVLAETTSWFFASNPADTVECDMRFSNAFPWYTGTATPPSTQFDWWSVAAHEMGHCLGLDHEDDLLTSTPVMASTFAPGEVRRTPTADDIAGRDAIYGSVGGPDFNGDGTADIVVWRPSQGVWYVLTSSSGFASAFTRQWGAALTFRLGAPISINTDPGNALLEDMLLSE